MDGYGSPLAGAALCRWEFNLVLYLPWNKGRRLHVTSSIFVLIC